MQHQYRAGCPCGRKGTSETPCPGRICRYHYQMQWHLYANLEVHEADYLFKRVAVDHAKFMEGQTNAKPRNYRNRWE
jgi:hypothetical protein